MPLQFIIGKASQDHFRTIVKQIKQSSQDQPNDQFFYLVPNHIKFDAEVNTLKQLNQNNSAAYAQTNIQILSLTRLVWFLFGKDPEYQIPRLNDSGVNMLLYQIILEHQDELSVFRGEGSRPGFISQLAGQISILQVGQIQPDDLTRILNTNDHLNQNLRAKLTDLALIYSVFKEQTNGKYLGKNDLLTVFTEKLQRVDLSHMHFFISGFSQMSAQELAIVTIMIQKAAAVTIDLNLDRATPNELPEEPNLFHQSAQLYQQLYRIAKQNKVPVLVDQWATPKRVNGDLSALEEYWIASNQFNGQIPTAKLKSHHLPIDDSIQVIKADNPAGEITKVALMIRQMVVSGNYRYGDFIVMTRHLDQFKNVIRPIFKTQEIPFFEDIQQTMDEHPLVELINALLTINQGSGRRNYRYVDVMRLLKSELLIPKDQAGNYMPLNHYRNDVALTENLILKNGYEGETVWTSSNDWQYIKVNSMDFTGKDRVDPAISKQINEIRHFIKDLLPPFYKKLKRAKNGAEAAKVLYNFLINNGVVDQLKKWREVAKNNNDLNEAGQPEQVWETFCDLLDDYVTILGERDFNLADFLELLQAGFEGASYSQIPSTLDQVAISESGITQTHKYKVVFMIGSTDETMPDKIVNDNLIGDGDQDELADSLSDQQFLPDSSEAKMANAPFLNYEAFMVGSEKLIFTYSLNNSNNEETGVKISPYVSRIMKHFNLVEQSFHSEVVANLDNILSYIGTKRMTLHHLVQAAYNSKQSGQDLSDSWRYVYHQLVNYGNDSRDLTNKLLGGVDYKNEPEPLKKEIATDLYSGILDSSISQLEDFYKNPYEYFLTYGLHLKKREEFELSSGNKGQFFHSVLERTVRIVNDTAGIDLRTIDKDTLLAIVEKVGQDIIKNDQRYQILHSSYQMKYIGKLLIKTAKRMALTMHWQSKYTPMRPRQTELSFGQSGRVANLAPLIFDLDKDHKLRIRGRIDRLDSFTAPQDNRKFLSIVDYKSGDKKINYDELYSGISIQLMTYLDVIKHNLGQYSQEQKAELAGALYLHIQDPVLSSKDLTGHQSFENAILKEQKYNGLLVNDPDIIDAIKADDLNGKNGRSSLLYKNLRASKDGITGNALVSNEQLLQLLDYTESLIKNAGQKIFNGDIDIYPVRTKTFDAMKYTDYSSIMQFDPLLTENRYRQIPDLKLADLLEKIKKGDFPHGLH